VFLYTGDNAKLCLFSHQLATLNRKLTALKGIDPVIKGRSGEVELPQWRHYRPHDPSWILSNQLARQ
jgi:hypothetical protein